MIGNLFLLGVFLLIACGGVSHGQVLAPPGAGDKTVGDRNIKDRQIELDRVEREAHKSQGKNQPQPEPMSAEKFAEVKEDFENLQRQQADIVTAYTNGDKMDRAKISSAASAMNKSGTRLRSNLFTTEEDAKKKKKKSKDDEKTVEPAGPQDLKELIVELDNAVGAFVGAPMFTNPQVVNAEANAKTRADLDKVIKLSAELKAAADGSAN